MPKTCYCGLKSNKKICKCAVITPLLAYIFAKRNLHKGCTFFFHNYNYQGDTGKCINKVAILDNKQLLSNMIGCEATQVPYTTRIAFLRDSYTFCSNYPAILCIILL